MTNELIKYQDESGEVVQITMNDVRNYICPEASDKDIVMFLNLCQAQKLNPWKKDAYLVGFTGRDGIFRASIITGKEVFTKRANANKKYQGFEAGVTYINARGEVCQREGSAVYKAAKETLVGGWCRVFVEGRKPFYDEVTLEEYSTGKSGWVKMPATMIRKVALVHCLREAFPDDFQGLYTAEEMGNAGDAVLQQDNAPKPVSEVSKPMMNDEPLQVHFVEMMNESQECDLGELIGQFAELRGKSFDDVKDAIFASETMKAAGAVAGEMLTFEQASLAIKLVENWVAKAQAAKVEQGFEAAQGHESPLAASMAAAQAAIADSELADDDILF